MGNEWGLEDLEQRRAEVEKLAADAAALSGRVARLSGMARSRDGLIEVTLDSSGVLSGLRLSDDVRRYSGSWIANQVLATARAARADLAARVRQTTLETVGKESALGRELVADYTRRMAAEQDRRDTARR